MVFRWWRSNPDQGSVKPQTLQPVLSSFVRRVLHSSDDGVKFGSDSPSCVTTVRFDPKLGVESPPRFTSSLESLPLHLSRIATNVTCAFIAASWFPIIRKLFELRNLIFRSPRNHHVLTLSLECLEERLAPTINVAVVGGSNNDSGFAAIVSQLNDHYYSSDLNATLVSPTQVNTVEQLNNYDVVVIGNNGLSPTTGSAFSTFASALKSWVQAGGGVVATGGTILGAGIASGNPLPDIDAIVPVNTQGAFSISIPGAVLQNVGPSHFVTNGVSLFGLSGGNYFEFPTGGGPGGNPLVDDGATVLGAVNDMPCVVVGNEGAGRGVYLGLNYAFVPGYNIDLRFGNADRLLQQAVTWAAGPNEQTITIQSLIDRTYGDGPFGISATTSSGLPASFKVVSGPATILGNNGLLITGAGTVTVEASQDGDGSAYLPATPVDKSFTVNKAHLTVKPNDKQRFYGQDNPALTYTLTGFINGENALSAGISGTAILSTPATATSPVSGSPYFISVDVSGLQAPNYDFIPATNYNSTPNYGLLFINKAHLTATADDQQRLYGQSNPALTYTLTGFVNGENATDAGVNGSSNLSTTATPNSPVSGSPYTISMDVSGLQAANYDFTPVNGKLTINKAHLTVTADDKSRGIGQDNPPFTATLTGFVNGETQANSVTGIAAFSTNATTTSPAGNYTITPTQGTLSAANYDFPSFVPGKLQILLALSKTVLQSSKNASVYGQSTTFFVTVSPLIDKGIPTGTVIFLVDGSPLVSNAATLVGGKYSFSTTALSAGNHLVSALYGGSTSYSGSSNSLTQSVNPATTKTVLSSSASTAAFGQTVTLTAKVSAQSPSSITPTGMVSFMDGSTVLGTPTLSKGVATLQTTSMAVGKHNLTAVYASDTGNDAASTSTTLAQTVNKAATKVVLASSLTPTAYGQVVTLTAMVSVVSPGAAPLSGPVTFKDGSTVLGTGNLTNGVATFPTAALTVGSHSLTAVYGGDANTASSTSAVLTQKVNKAATQVNLSLSLSSVLFGQSVTLTAQVSVIAPGMANLTGTVTFKDGTTVLGTMTVNGNGVATFSTMKLAKGQRKLTAVYNGDSHTAGSTSTVMTETVN